MFKPAFLVIVLVLMLDRRKTDYDHEQEQEQEQECLRLSYPADIPLRCSTSVSFENNPTL